MFTFIFYITTLQVRLYEDETLKRNNEVITDLRAQIEMLKVRAYDDGVLYYQWCLRFLTFLIFLVNRLGISNKPILAYKSSPPTNDTGLSIH